MPSERAKPAGNETPRSMPLVMPGPDDSAIVPMPPPVVSAPPAVSPPVVSVAPSAPVASPVVSAPPVSVPEPAAAPAAANEAMNALASASPVAPVDALRVADPIPAPAVVEALPEPAAATEPVAAPVVAETPAEAPAKEPAVAVAALPDRSAEQVAAPAANPVVEALAAKPVVELVAPKPAVAAKPAVEAIAVTAATSSQVPGPMPGRLPPYRTAALGEQPVETSVQVEEAVVNTVEQPRLVFITLPKPKPPLSPAQRLELHGKDYDRAEKCLAQAIYFEARNEPVRGQQAVAQVVLNRVFSPHYPKDVCSVVFQNAHRHLSCQFTFACDGKPESIRERGAWARAQRIARETLDANIWLPDVNKATHYHAAYVKPRWIRDMKVMVRHGLHTFYRPRNWGDGSNEAKWGTPSNSVKSAPTAAKPLTPAQKRFSYHKA
jgi:hypothetical protein